MTVDESRLDAKTKGAVVIDLDEVRKRNQQSHGILTGLRNPDQEKLISFLILFALAVAAGWIVFRVR
jgi:hypothetical protein